MIVKNVDSNGIISLTDGEKMVLSIATSVEREHEKLSVAFDGMLRTDVQPYLATELQFYSAADINKIEIDCGKLTAVSPGCFGELLDLKIKMTEKKAEISFNNKPDCLCSMEKLMGKKL